MVVLNVISEPAASASPENLSEMKILGLQLRPTASESLELRA